jgi:cardiolipin synthase
VTTANQITLLRILLIPVFIGFAVYYAHSVQDGAPDEQLRYWAILVFTVAALSDLLDGWLARHYNQRTRLGAILDPLADKLLLLSAVCVLSFSAWPARLPLWFVIILLSREVLTIAGAFVIQHVAGKVHIEPHWTGKLSTFTQIAAIGCSMFAWNALVPWVAAVASVFAFSSGMIYVVDAVRQCQVGGHDKP